MRVPETNIPCGGSGHIDLDQLRAREDISNSEKHIHKLRGTNVARLADLDNRSRFVFVCKLISDTADLGPNFSIESAQKEPISPILEYYEVRLGSTDLVPGGILRVSLTR